MKCPSCGARRRTTLVVGALAIGQLLLSACAERAVAPAESTEAASSAPIVSVTVRDAAERVAPSLARSDIARELTVAFGRLRTDLEAGQLSEAASSVASARHCLQSARAADDGAMTADLTVLALALDDVSGLLASALTVRSRGHD